MLDPPVPNRPKAAAHNSLGTGLVRLGRFAAAMREYQRAIALAPSYAEAHSNLGAALYKQGLLGPAIEAYRQAIDGSGRQRITEPAGEKANPVVK
jgi:Flp pilus assembly protein TadD